MVAKRRSKRPRATSGDLDVANPLLTAVNRGDPAAAQQYTSLGLRELGSSSRTRPKRSRQVEEEEELQRDIPSSPSVTLLSSPPRPQGTTQFLSNTQDTLFVRNSQDRRQDSVGDNDITDLGAGQNEEEEEEEEEWEFDGN